MASLIVLHHERHCRDMSLARAGSSSQGPFCSGRHNASDKSIVALGRNVIELHLRLISGLAVEVVLSLLAQSCFHALIIRDHEQRHTNASDVVLGTQRGPNSAFSFQLPTYD